MSFRIPLLENTFISLCDLRQRVSVGFLWHMMHSAHQFITKPPLLMLHLSSLVDERDPKRPRLSSSEDCVLEDLVQLWKSLWEHSVNPVQEVAVRRGSDYLEDIDVPITMKVLHGVPGFFAF